MIGVKERLQLIGADLLVASESFGTKIEIIFKQ
jgi:signal transduction histidine kinase